MPGRRTCMRVRVCFCDRESGEPKNTACWSHNTCCNVNFSLSSQSLTHTTNAAIEKVETQYTSRLQNCSRKAGGGVMTSHGYPAWCRKGQTTSRLAVLKQSGQIYSQVFPRTKLPGGIFSAFKFLLKLSAWILNYL